MTVAADRRLVVWTGGLVLGAVVVVALPALWLVWWAALAGTIALVVWDAHLLGRRPLLGVHRVLPERAFIGRAQPVTLRLENPSPEPVACSALDTAPADLCPQEPIFTDVTVAGGGTRELTWMMRPTRRGDRVFGPVVCLARSPLGLLRRRTEHDDAQALAVWPDTTRYLRPEALAPRRVLTLLGLRPQRRRGEGMEFESLQEYVAGDDPRRIDWAASARRGRLITRRYQHERNHLLLLALDASRLMGAPVGTGTKLDHAVDAALALAWAGLTSGDRVGAIVFDHEVRGWVAPRRHRRDLGAIVELLRVAQPTATEASYWALTRTLAARHRGRAIIVVLTDFTEAAPETLLEPLGVLAQRHRVLLVSLRDRVFSALTPPVAADDPPLGLHRRLVLDHLLQEREVALAAARRAGVQTLDLVPEQVTAAVLNRWMALRQEAR